ncbi:hypothetical protein [Thiolinea disciformis]|uniref:hypothetical protein n=1 Tax=Thiolinea disciformis TaxID=125614 RepID=UPI0003646A60|nr:hypothetical protein [Thiolinea disciformis]
MRAPIIVYLLLVASIATGYAATKIDDPCAKKQGAEKCDCYVQQVDEYEAKMRAGYKAKDYNELEQKRRFFRDHAFNCKA